MLKKLVLLLGLASSLAAAVPAPEHTSGGSSGGHDYENVIISDISQTGSVSDNACYVRELPRVAPTFRHPRADVCVDIAARRRIKIYTAATCRNGTEALFARYGGPGCAGGPESLRAAGEEMLGACLDMPLRDGGAGGAGSYGFWCDGVEERAPPPPSSRPNNSGGGSIWGLIGILLLILVTVLLIAGLKLASFVSRAADRGNRFLGIFGKREGEIALR